MLTPPTPPLQLQSQLSEARSQADKANADAASSKTEVDALVAAGVADAIQDIRAVQKSRDDAMMARVRVANEERDAALDRSRRLEERLEDS